MNHGRHQRWMTLLLVISGAYSLAWSIVLAAAPGFLYRAAGLTPPNYPELVQLVALGLALLGLGYLIASADPFRHWPVICMGLIAKSASALFLTFRVIRGSYPADALWMALFNDAVWVVPFGIILSAAYQANLNVRRTVAPEIVKMALRSRTQHDVTIDELTRLSPTLMVFLRHAGCTFCREALSDLAAQRTAIEKNGTRLVLVHMGTEAQARVFFARYGLEDVPRIADPNRSLYRAFGLKRGGILELLGPKVWWRGLEAGIFGRHGVGRFVGDGFQMPGIFLLYHGEIVRSYRHQSASDRPNYTALVTGQEYERPEVRS